MPPPTEIYRLVYTLWVSVCLCRVCVTTKGPKFAQSFELSLSVCLSTCLWARICVTHSVYTAYPKQRDVTAGRRCELSGRTLLHTASLNESFLDGVQSMGNPRRERHNAIKTMQQCSNSQFPFPPRSNFPVKRVRSEYTKLTRIHQYRV